MQVRQKTLTSVLLTDYNEVVSVEFELTKHQFTYLQLKYAAIA